MGRIIILRSKNNGTISGTLPPGVNLPINTPLMLSGMDEAGQRSFALADGEFDGLVTREVRNVGDANPRTDTEMLWNFGVESPFRAGFEGAIERVESLTAEGGEYIVSSGTGAITADTPVNTQISCKGGKFCVAQTGQRVLFRLASQLAATDGGDFKIQLEEVNGPVVAA